MWCLSVFFFFYKLGFRYVFGECWREILVRNYRGGCYWFVDGSYKYGTVISILGNYGEEGEARVEIAVGKFVIYRVEEGLGVVGKGGWSVMLWKLEEGSVE